MLWLILNYSKRIVDTIIDRESEQGHFSDPDEARAFLKSANMLVAFNGKEHFSDKTILQLANTIKAGREKGGYADEID